MKTYYGKDSQLWSTSTPGSGSYCFSALLAQQTLKNLLKWVKEIQESPKIFLAPYESTRQQHGLDVHI